MRVVISHWAMWMLAKNLVFGMLFIRREVFETFALEVFKSEIKEKLAAQRKKQQALEVQLGSVIIRQEYIEARIASVITKQESMEAKQDERTSNIKAILHFLKKKPYVLLLYFVIIKISLLIVVLFHKNYTKVKKYVLSTS